MISQALKLLTSLPRRRADDEAGKLDLEAYQIALKGVTRYGLNLATQAVLRGAHGHAFFPSPAELRRQCDAAMEPIWRRQREEALRDESRMIAKRCAEIEACRTSEARRRVESVYRRFAEQYEKARVASDGFDWSAVNRRFDRERA